MIRLIYVSTASRALPTELKEIVASSQSNNARVGITGAMCLIDGVYLQLLEGDDWTVQHLYNRRIAVDPRHTDPKILDLSPIETRYFPNWGMGLLTWNDETTEIFARFNALKANDLYSADSTSVNALFEAWASSKNWMAR